MRSTIKWAGLLGLATLQKVAGFSTSCSAGNYLRQGAACKPCGRGQYCPGGTEWVPRRCDEGYYSDYKATACTICAEGYSCNWPEGPMPCPANKFSPRGSKDCTVTPNGSVSDQGVLVVCKGGEQCNNSSSIQGKPLVCRSGYKCDGTNESRCNNGQWTMNIVPGTIPGVKQEGSSQCFDCPKGYKCETGTHRATHPPIPCPPGEYVESSNPSTCLKCGAGFECPGGLFLYPPATGANANAARPAQRRKCPMGTFAPVTGFSVCQPCPAGFACLNPAVFPVACARGSAGAETYSLEGWTHCALCPAGQKCDRQNEAVLATVGYYSLEGDLHETPCPPGHECRLAQQKPQKCEPGYFSFGKVVACTVCPVGHFCELANAPPNKCPPGTAALKTGQSFCVKFGGGFRTTDNGVTQVGCPTTGGVQISNSIGAGHCELCPAGYACPGLLFENIKPCGPGYFSKLGAQECEVIKAGFYVADTSATDVQVGNTLFEPVTVPTGYQTNIGDATAYKCPPGYSCKDKWRRHNVMCKPGSYYAIHTDVCVDCPIGKYCPADIGGYRGAGITCPDGTYSAAVGATECKPCPPGYACSDKTLSPEPCAKEKYQPGGHKLCITIPIGFEGNFGQTIAPCPSMFYAAAGKGDCKPCPAGKNCYTPDGLNVAGQQQSQKAPEDCLAGYYSSASDLRCVECPKGHSCGATHEFATPCQAGSYNSKTAQDSCVKCPTGFYSLMGAEYCTPIPKGWKAKQATTFNIDIEMCTQKTYSDLGQETCSPCANGFLCPAGTGEASNWEFSCPRGSWCVAGVQTKCPAGSFGTMERAVSAAEGCSLCPPGYNCPPGTADFMANPCPRGAFCGKGVAMSVCPENTNNDSMFGRSIADCSRCGAGMQCGVATADKGAPCAENSWCGTGQWGYCAGGTFGGYKTGKTSPDQCLLCPPGHYCPRPTSATSTALPTPAPAGYYTPLTGVRELAALFKCPPGFFCPLTGMAIYKGHHCQAGYVCPAGSKLATEVKCPEGTWSDRVGLSDIEQCNKCPAGYQCKENSTSSNSRITDCPINQFCPAGTRFSDTPKCPAGTFTGGHTKAKRLIDCLPCTPGMYCLTGVAPVTCPAGHYCPEGTRFSTQYACPAGYYNILTGKSAKQECLHCGIGKYCPAKARTTVGIFCAAGTYNNIKTNAIVCEVCPAGKFCVVTAETAGLVNAEPANCVPGTYSHRGQIAQAGCLYCPVGHYCPLNGTSYDQMKTNLCPEGTYCQRFYTPASIKLEVGLDKYPSSETNKCPRYKYCPKGLSVTADPTLVDPAVYANLPKVPPGLSQRFFAVGKLSLAEAMPAGFFFKEKLASDNTPMDPCPTGHYCPEGTVTPIGCPKGTYRNDVHATDVGQCGLCPSGTYCPSEGMSLPTVCPIGMFCPEGSIFTNPCPPGTYNIVTGLYDSRECTPCSAGYYCPVAGMNKLPKLYTNGLTGTALIYTYQCDAGFICIQGSLRPEPIDEVTGSYCPQGGYCPAGVNRDRAADATMCGQAAPLGYFSGCNCAKGKFGLYKGAQEIGECADCWPGYYCQGVAGPDSKKPCKAGVVCAALAESEETTDAAVSLPLKGSYANIQSAQAWKCEIGSYSKEDGVKACLPCPAGYFCDKPGRVNVTYATTDAATKLGWTVCKVGFYCPSLAERQAKPNAADRFYEMEPCPKGTYQPIVNKILYTDCLVCPATKACNQKGLGVAVTALPECAKGFFCGKSATSTHPYETQGTDFGPCPAGSWCGFATETPTKCLAGFYSNQQRAIDISYCIPCPPGYLCEGGTTTVGPGLTAPQKFCPFGHMCKTTGIAPAGSVSCGGSASAGKFCPLGSHEEMWCPTGFWQQAPQKAQCDACPAGSFCIRGQVAACPKGYYCP